MKNNTTTFTVHLINHDEPQEAWMAVTATHFVHALRKAEKNLGKGWEAVEVR